ncbi:MAG TPA: CorA family divalent cation transporter [Candidatus Paceibacterota bacterium]
MIEVLYTITMVNINEYKNLTWTDASSPTKDELESIINQYDLHPIIVEELLSPTRKPKIEIYGKYIFLALHIPIHENINKKRVIKSKEIDFVIGKDFIITSHDEIIEPLHEFSKMFETNTILDKRGIGNHAGIIFFYIIKKLYEYMINDLENIKDSLIDVEKHIFSGHERRMVERLSDISRELIDFKQIIHLHREILESFSTIPGELFGKDFDYYIDEMKHAYTSVHGLVLSNKELLSDLRETNDSLLSTKQNEHMKLFSILAFVTFPLMLFLNIFMLPTSHTPIIGYDYDWEILVGTVIVLAIGMFYFFKKKGWI